MHTNMSFETLIVNIILMLLERSASVINADHQVYSLTCFTHEAQSSLLVEFIIFFPLLSHQHRSLWDNGNRFWAALKLMLKHCVSYRYLGFLPKC